MAIIECTECGHKLSEKASQCPNCGCPIEEIQAARAERAIKELEERQRAEQEKIQAEKEAALKAQREAEEVRRAKKEQEKQKRKEARVAQRGKLKPYRTTAIILVVVAALAALGYFGYRIIDNHNRNAQSEASIYKQKLSEEHVILAEYLSGKNQCLIYSEIHPGSADFEPVVHLYDLATKETLDYAIASQDGAPAPEFISQYKLIGNKLAIIATVEDPDSYIWREQIYYLDIDARTLNFVDFGEKAGFDQNNHIVVGKTLSEKDSTGKIKEYTQPYMASFDINAKPARLKYRMKMEAEHNSVIKEVYSRHYICPSWVSGMWYRQITDKDNKRVGELSFKFEKKNYSMYADDELLYRGKIRYKDNVITIEDLNMQFYLDTAKTSITDNRNNEFSREKQGPVQKLSVRQGAVKFTCEDDVYEYLAQHTFVSPNFHSEIQITPESIKVDGVLIYPDMPEVVNVDSTMALIRLNENYHLLVDLAHDRLWDEERNFYYAKSN